MSLMARLKPPAWALHTHSKDWQATVMEDRLRRRSLHSQFLGALFGMGVRCRLQESARTVTVPNRGDVPDGRPFGLIRNW